MMKIPKYICITYRCRCHGEGAHKWKTIKVPEYDQTPSCAAAIFAEEYGVKDWEKVDVFRHGTFRIYVDWEPVFYAKKL